MSTPFKAVYDAFLAKLPDDDDTWEGWPVEDMEEDMRSLMESAILNFKFPRISLVRSKSEFSNDIGNEEIQIIATYMKCEWLERKILSWQNIEPQYDERDYSPAKQLAALNNTLNNTRDRARLLESYYYRSIDGKPFKYSKWAGTSN